MKNKHKIVFVLAVIGAAAVTVYLSRRVKTKKMLSQVSNEGYETAPDILFPNRKLSSRLHYGPVIPDSGNL